MSDINDPQEFKGFDESAERGLDEFTSGFTYKKVLVVDDITYVIKSIARILKSLNFLVFSAKSGEEALSKFLKHKPHLITIDQKLPDMTGFQLVEKIRSLETDFHPKIIFISAVHHKEEIRSILKLGVDNYILKPFKRQTLIDIVKELIG